MTQLCEGWSNIQSRSPNRIALGFSIFLSTACSGEPASGPLPRRSPLVGCDREGSGLPLKCPPEFGRDGIGAARFVRRELLLMEKEVCFQADGTTEWIPPLEAKCSWAPGRRCLLVGDGESPRKPWEYSYPKNRYSEVLRRSLGVKWKELLEDASSMHMRASWKSNENECLFVFEAWGDADNDGSFAVDGVVFLLDRNGENLNHRVFTEFSHRDEEGNVPRTRRPGAPFPLTLNVFSPHAGLREVLDDYILGEADGSDLSGPLADYKEWAEEQL